MKIHADSCNRKPVFPSLPPSLPCHTEENTEYEKKRSAVEEGRRREKDDRASEDTRREKDEEERKARITELDAKLGEEEGRLQV